MPDYLKNSAVSLGALLRYHRESGNLNTKQIETGFLVCDDTAATMLRDSGDYRLESWLNALSTLPMPVANDLHQLMDQAYRSRQDVREVVAGNCERHLGAAVEQIGKAQCRLHDAKADGYIDTDEHAEINSEFNKARSHLDNATARLGKPGRVRMAQ